MEAKNKKEQTAVQIAYKMVLHLGYSHARIMEVDNTLTFKTLRRIRQGKTGKITTDRYYLKVFVSIINKEYERRLEEEGICDKLLLVCIKNILIKVL